MKRLPMLIIGLVLTIVGGAPLFLLASGYTLHLSFGKDGDAAFATLVPIVMFILFICAFILWLRALVDLLNNQAIQGTDKIVWVLVIIFVNVLGAVIYFLSAPRKRRVVSPFSRPFAACPYGNPKALL